MQEDDEYFSQVIESCLELKNMLMSLKTVRLLLKKDWTYGKPRWPDTVRSHAERLLKMAYNSENEVGKLASR